MSNTKNPKLAIGLPVYNAEPFVHQSKKFTKNLDVHLGHLKIHRHMVPMKKELE